MSYKWVPVEEFTTETDFPYADDDGNYAEDDTEYVRYNNGTFVIEQRPIRIDLGSQYAICKRELADEPHSVDNLRREIKILEIEIKQLVDRNKFLNDWIKRQESIGSEAETVYGKDISLLCEFVLGIASVGWHPQTREASRAALRLITWLQSRKEDGEAEEA
jgi:hypothetical protein